MADLADIENQAIKLYQEAGGHGTAPIQVSAVIHAAFPTAHIGPADLGSVQGALVTEMGRAAFYYREEDTNREQNFVLAHLLWHFLRQSKRGQLDLTRQCQAEDQRTEEMILDPDERDADTFATELLAPLDLLEEAVNFSPNPRNEQERQVLETKTEELATLFGISAELMSQRLAVFAARRRPT